MSDPSDVLRRVAIELSSISESALAYCRDPFDIDRFHRIGEIAQEVAQLVAREPLPDYDRRVASIAGYTTPKVDVRGGVFDESGRILLVREIADEGRWTLPGGWCDVLETPTSAIEREVAEEAGVPVRAVHLAAIIDRHRWPHEPVYDRHMYKLFFVCEPLGPVDLLFTSEETSEIGWFAADDLPELSIERVVPDQILLLHEHWRSPGPAHID
ncbi:NUDIX domain-containing protein [Flaviflexus salsibiostraticola]|uniref:NUDIX domain-containing protein n=1 Tax=Flaviflexus salsibiostraticola TaxID=1282737 RepID=A0A3S8Z6D8_9ACTO|nr:NUDIX hydrolase N-terminal domain-containing protein [Flaviflexus salsibiostraticola]AZN29029.1 NUDIX domain-containing protein [Flaviflexus salsibiostraticola]